MTIKKKARSNHDYYFVDVDLSSRQIIGWGSEKRDTVEVNLTSGFHRIFLSKGQFNKFEKKLAQN